MSTIDHRDKSPQILWIASYPKSGNTWVRFIVASILAGEVVNSSKRVESLTPDVHKTNSFKLQNDGAKLCIKTHWLCRSQMRHYSLTRGAIYVARNPGDVLVSNLNYLNVPKEAWSTSVDTFIALGGVPRWMEKHAFGSWIENVESWLYQQQPFPVHLIRYEDLLANPVKCIRDIGEFLKLPISLELAEDIKRATSFATLKELEISEVRHGTKGLFFDHAQQSIENRPAFMRTGKINQYLNLLSREQIRQFEDRFYPIMERLGYAIKDSETAPNP